MGFLGGEPFLNPHLFNFLEESHKRGKITTVVSNGSLIKDEIKESLLRVFPTMLGLSWYDNNEDNIFELSNWLQQQENFFWVQTVISSDNVQSMFRKLEKAKKNKIKNLIFSNYNPVYSGLKDKVIFDDNLEFKKIGKDLLKLSKEFGIDLTLPQPIQKIPKKIDMAAL